MKAQSMYSCGKTSFADSFRELFRPPSGSQGRGADGSARKTGVVIEQTQILIYVGEPPLFRESEIHFDFLPVEKLYQCRSMGLFADPVNILTGEYQLYLPGQAVRSEDTRFFPHTGADAHHSFHGGELITVGAIQGAYDAYAGFSGRVC